MGGARVGATAVVKERIVPVVHIFAELLLNPVELSGNPPELELALALDDPQLSALCLRSSATAHADEDSAGVHRYGSPCLRRIPEMMFVACMWPYVSGCCEYWIAGRVGCSLGGRSTSLQR